jgi:hypothetical protein
MASGVRLASAMEPLMSAPRPTTATWDGIIGGAEIKAD